MLFHTPKNLVSPWAVIRSVETCQLEVLLGLFAHTASKARCGYASDRGHWPCYWVCTSQTDGQPSLHVKMDGRKEELHRLGYP